MSQFDFATIDPNAKSGTQLAVDLNNWRDALHSCHRGAERPIYAQGGMLWVRETSSEQWDLMFYDGDTDFVLRSVNPTTNELIAIPQSAVSGLSQVIADFETSLTGKQAADPLLTAIAALVTSADKLLYFTGADAVAQTTLTAFARTLLDDADAAAARATLGISGDLGLGYGQTWQDVKANRTSGVSYTNTTGKPIMVHITQVRGANVTLTVVVDGVTIGNVGQGGGAYADMTISFIVPNGATYSATSTVNPIRDWAELR